ncbi:hypothetical protein HPB48_002945 [Haemaphysalis longicornis]|uniref:Uncharacterized protein n=1 Tax=Haemaphysalis longicornis TaxID=44386 RepID=A0A9J6FDU2_HAELO|nr:hypothetical protein HPB48_002945 [Haemaphysalis longicornis]
MLTAPRKQRGHGRSAYGERFPGRRTWKVEQDARRPPARASHERRPAELISSSGKLSALIVAGGNGRQCALEPRFSAPAICMRPARSFRSQATAAARGLRLPGEREGATTPGHDETARSVDGLGGRLHGCPPRQLFSRSSSRVSSPNASTPSAVANGKREASGRGEGRERAPCRSPRLAAKKGSGREKTSCARTGPLAGGAQWPLLLGAQTDGSLQKCARRRGRTVTLVACTRRSCPSTHPSRGEGGGGGGRSQLCSHVDEIDINLLMLRGREDYLAPDHYAGHDFLVWGEVFWWARCNCGLRDVRAEGRSCVGALYLRRPKTFQRALGAAWTGCAPADRHRGFCMPITRALGWDGRSSPPADFFLASLFCRRRLIGRHWVRCCCCSRALRRRQRRVAALVPTCAPSKSADLGRRQCLFCAEHWESRFPHRQSSVIAAPRFQERPDNGAKRNRDALARSFVCGTAEAELPPSAVISEAPANDRAPSRGCTRLPVPRSRSPVDALPNYFRRTLMTVLQTAPKLLLQLQMNVHTAGQYNR